MHAPHPSSPATGRLRALDAFRGATVAGMILVNNPGSWKHLYPPLAHADWHGLTPTDLVFPFFLFAVGNALAITLPALLRQPAAQVAAKVMRRTVLIFLIGLLQRIALAWGAAALLLWAAHALARHRGAAALAPGADVRVAVAASAVLLLAYWAACVAFAHGPDPYSLEGFFGTHLDRAVLGSAHLYRGEGVPFDPEGLASTLPAVAQVLLGYAVGRLVVSQPAPDDALLVRLFVAACALVALAWGWHAAMPVNKKIWTSSYVLVTTGAAVASLALMLRSIEMHGARGAWVGWLEAHGRNALFIFVLSGFVPRVLALFRWGDGVDAEGRPRWLTPLPWLYRTLFEPLGTLAGDPRLGSLAFALAHVALYTALAVAMDRRGLYVKV